MTEIDPKLLKNVVKEGGKRGIEIQGASEMGGLDFFCTKVDEPAGSVELLLKSMEAMNEPCDENDEERKGGSGAVGKMIFSCDENTLAVVAYVPTALKEKIDVKAWIEHVIEKYGGTVNELENEETASGFVKANPKKNVYTLKIRDELLQMAIQYLISMGAFPDDDDDDSDDDDMVFGDDTDFDAL